MVTFLGPARSRHGLSAGGRASNPGASPRGEAAQLDWRPVRWRRGTAKSARPLGAVAALLVTMTLAVDTSHPTVARAGGHRPNVLIIVTDDQRAEDTLEVLPALEHWFGATGVRFEHAYATTPQCCPSRASIFTGRYAHNHGVLSNVQGPRDLDHRTTLQRYLDQGGYTTGLFGRFLNGWDLEHEPPWFDRWAIFAGGYRAKRFNVMGEVVTIDDRTTDVVEREALRFLREEGPSQRPWLAMVTPFEPHMGRGMVAPEYRQAQLPPFRPNPGMLEKRIGDKPAFFQDAATTMRKVRRTRRSQLRSLLSVNDLLRRIHTALARLGELDDTLAIFTSDNGLLWGEHRLAGKAVPYLQAVRIPLLLSWPGHVAPGEVVHRIVANIDIAPTVLQAAGIAPDHVVDGRSLLDGPKRRRLLLEAWGSHTRPGLVWSSLLSKRKQYTEYLAGGPPRLLEAEYYDLRDDAWQLRNLLGDNSRDNDPDISSERRRLREARSCRGAACP